MDFKIGIVGIRLAREHGFHLPARGFRLQALERFFSFANDIGVALFLAKLDQLDIVGKLLFQRAHAADAIVKLLALAHQLLRLGSVVPEGRIL